MVFFLLCRRREEKSMKPKSILLINFLFHFFSFSNCATLFWDTPIWSTVYSSNNTKIVELDNSKRYIHLTKDSTAVKFCLEQVGPSTKDDIYKFSLSSPNASITGNKETKASVIYTVGDIIQFSQTSLFHICGNYINGFYEDFGRAKKIKYRNDFNEILRKTALLIAIHSGDNINKAKLIAVLNLYERKQEILKDKIEILGYLQELKNDQKNSSDIEKLEKPLKEIDDENKLLDSKNSDMKNILEKIVDKS